MRFASHAKAAANNLLYSPLRTLLAMIGISVGTASVVALISSGNLAAQKALELFKSLGTEQMSLSFYPISKKASQPKPIRLEQLMALKDSVPQIKFIAPYATDGVQATYKGIAFVSGIIGSNEQLAKILKIRLKQGRFFMDLDNNEEFCVVGSQVLKSLKDISPLGQRIKLGNVIFKIIGVEDAWPENNFFTEDVNNSILIPLNLMKLLNSSPPVLNQMILELKVGSDIDLVKDKITTFFTKNFPEYSVNVASSKELIKRMNDQQSTFTLLLAFIGAISLFVGGIGVMNIMLASVSERRYEIGLRLAIGAQPKDIQLMFLLEAIILSMMGGGLGVLMGIFSTFIVAFFSGWTFALYYLPPIIGFSFSVLISVFFGFYPAYIASQLNPIEALRAG